MDKLELIEMVKSLTEKAKVRTFDSESNVYNAAVRHGYALAMKDVTDEVIKWVSSQ